MDWITLIWSGFVATTIATTYFWLTRSLGWTTLSPAIQIGCLFNRNPRTPITETIGMLIIFLVGSTFGPAFFRFLIPLLPLQPWAGGSVLGIFLGIIMAAALPLHGTISACVRAGTVPPPGRFGIAWGRPTPAIIAAGLGIYGGVAGAILAAFQT